MGDLKNQKGMALVLFLAILLMLTLVGVVAIINSSNNLEVSGNKMSSNNTLYAADQGLEKAINKIRIHHDTLATVIPLAQLPSGTFTSGGITVTYSTQYDSFGISSGWFVNDAGTIRYQLYQGLLARKIYYVVTSQATSSDGRYRSRVSSRVVANMLRLFSFDAFYDGRDLEFSSEQAYANDIHFQHIHSNSNIYLEQPPTTPGANRLFFNAGVTAGQNVYWGHNPTFTDPSYPAYTQPKYGRVLIASSPTTFDTLNINNINTGDTANWVNLSLTRWRERVEDSHHGIHQTTLRVVRPYGTNPIDWIARATAAPTMSLERNGVCGLKIWETELRDSSALWWNGTVWQNAKNAIFRSTPPVVSINTSYDYRDSVALQLYSLNLGRLWASGCWPRTNILYITKLSTLPARTQHAIRIFNAATLDTDLTIVSNLPVYIQGNFNTVTPQRAVIIADAVTAVSDNSPKLFTAWTNLTSYDNRKVQSDTVFADSNLTITMTINAAIVTGNVPTNAWGFSGGVNNLVRLLQNWNNDMLIIQGPQICLWNSQRLTRKYRFPNETGPYYDDPLFRHIGSDTSLGMPYNVNGDSIGLVWDPDSLGGMYVATRLYPIFPDDGPFAVYIEVLNRTIEETQ